VIPGQSLQRFQLRPIEQIEEFFSPHEREFRRCAAKQAVLALRMYSADDLSKRRLSEPFKQLQNLHKLQSLRTIFSRWLRITLKRKQMKEQFIETRGRRLRLLSMKLLFKAWLSKTKAQRSTKEKQQKVNAAQQTMFFDFQELSIEQRVLRSHGISDYRVPTIQTCIKNSNPPNFSQKSTCQSAVLNRLRTHAPSLSVPSKSTLSNQQKDSKTRRALKFDTQMANASDKSPELLNQLAANKSLLRANSITQNPLRPNLYSSSRRSLAKKRNRSRERYVAGDVLASIDGLPRSIKKRFNLPMAEDQMRKVKQSTSPNRNNLFDNNPEINDTSIMTEKQQISEMLHREQNELDRLKNLTSDLERLSMLRPRPI